jgi:hypothetical protein
MSERGTIVRTSGGVTVFIPDHTVPISGTIKTFFYRGLGKMEYKEKDKNE